LKGKNTLEKGFYLRFRRKEKRGRKGKMITPCGVYCSKECSFFNNGCSGCHEIKGKVFWAKHYGSDICPIYECVQERELKNCGHCSRLPCRLWFSTRDPSLGDEEFQKEIAFRLSNLEKERNS